MTEFQTFDVPSAVAFLAWPGIPAPEGANLLAMQYSFERTLELPSQEIQALQWKQLSILLAHAKSTISFYQDKSVYSWPDRVNSIEDFSELPILTRSMVQKAGDMLLSNAIPKEHGAISSIQTSGSTGQPIKAYRTALFNFFWRAFTVRDHLLHRRNFSLKLAAIRPEINLQPGQSHSFKNWGTATQPIVKSGNSIVMSSNSNINAQADWLIKENPAYLLTMPSNLYALAIFFQQANLQLPGLRELRTYGETLTAHCRELCAEVFGVKIKDMYSAQEVGYLALQHPENETYLVQSEGVYLEVLRENGEACTEGEIGSVVVTPLHNFAMPLLRYEIGDYAQVAEQNPKGVGSLLLEKILGRTRNMLVLPDGSKHWPSFPAELWRAIAPIKQFQLTQKERKTIEVRLVVETALTKEQEQAVKAMLSKQLFYPFKYKLIYVSMIERAKSGKFEDFISLVI